jgi:hypothetical protein
LKAGEWFRRGRLLMVSPVHGDYRRYQAETPLIALSRFPRPALPAFHPCPPCGQRRGRALCVPDWRCPGKEKPRQGCGVFLVSEHFGFLILPEPVAPLLGGLLSDFRSLLDTKATANRNLSWYFLKDVIGAVMVFAVRRSIDDEVVAIFIDETFYLKAEAFLF